MSVAAWLRTSSSSFISRKSVEESVAGRLRDAERERDEDAEDEDAEEEDKVDEEEDEEASA